MQGIPRMALTRAVMNRVAPTRQVLTRLVPAIISAALMLCLSLLVWAEGAAEFADQSPEPELPELYTDVYADESVNGRLYFDMRERPR